MSCTASTAASRPRAAAPSAAHRSQARASRGALLVRATQQPKQLPTQVAAAVDLVLKRYDFVSTGVGALAVTATCVAAGQDPMTALGITCGATIMGLVISEVLFTQDR